MLQSIDDLQVTAIATMDNETARIGAQELDHESPKDRSSPDFEKRISDETSPDSSKPSIGHTEISNGSEKQDVEAGEEEVDDPQPVKVPRSKRRGLFGRFTFVAEVDDPKLYPRKIKWFITFNIALAAVAAPLGSAIVFRKL